MKKRSLTPSPTESIFRRRSSIGSAGALNTGPSAPMPLLCTTTTGGAAEAAAETGVGAEETAFMTPDSSAVPGPCIKG